MTCAPPAIAHALSNEHRRVRHRANHRDRLRERRLDALRRESGDHRQQSRRAHGARHSRDGFGVLGLDANHDTAGVVHVLDLERRDDGDTGKSSGQRLALFRGRLDDRHFVRRTPSGIDETFGEGRAHSSTAHDDQLERHESTLQGCQVVFLRRR